MRLPPAVICAAMSAGLLAGCGSTTIHHVTTTITRPAPAATTSASSSTTGTSSSTAGAGSPKRSHRSAVAGRSAQATLQAAADALRRARGYALHANLLQDHKRTTINLSADGPRTFAASSSTGSIAFQVIAVRRRGYLRGNRAFWRGHSGPGSAAAARAARLAGRWLRLPTSGPDAVAGTLGTIGPATLARCLTEDHGTLTRSGPTIVAGHRAVIVKDAGNAPGSTPSTIAVAAGPTPYPLRYVATGATRRGGHVDVCNDGKGDGATGTITLDRFGSAPAIHAPSAQSGPAGPAV